MAKKKRRMTRKKRNRYILCGLFGFVLIISMLLVLVLFKDTETEFEPEPIKMYYDIDQFEEDEYGWIHFKDKNYTYTHGIDVSQFQHDIDWTLVKETNIDFAIIRAGYRGAIEGLLHTDEHYEENMQNAIMNNIDVGVYWYSSALNEEELLEEIDYLLELLEPYNLSYPVVYDMEPYEQDETGGRISILSVQEKTDLANQFCKKMKEYGYSTMVYGNLDWLYNNLDFNQIANQDIWYAAYQNKPAMPDRFTMWQFSNKGLFPGIDTTVDMNIYIMEREKEDE